MESNQEQEMLLWKSEPVSPSGTWPVEVDDDWLLFDDKSVGPTNNAADNDEKNHHHPSRAQVATKLLEELDEWIKEEPFSDWLEEKIDLPIFEELPVPENGQNKPTICTGPAKIVHQDDTQTLLQEFETVLGDVEACHQIVPSSPPPHKPMTVDTQLLVTLQPVQPLFTAQQLVYDLVIPDEKAYVGEVPTQWPTTENVAPLDPLSTEVANELAVVDEYVRSHTQDLPPASPCTSSGGSYTSSEDSVDDPDWILEPGRRPTSRPALGYSSSRNRHKPYSRPSLEDKKVRKKEQNKNAATRYRQKKKQEIKEILGEEHELTEHNKRLQNQVKDLQREIGYLKGLMRELFKRKGLIK